ncbi:hypothetical protein BLOT_003223 [Blomia tropicalis]|nr:hypothetical protein BLOT_003223 [Blomia tropicalis]
MIRILAAQEPYTFNEASTGCLFSVLHRARETAPRKLDGFTQQLYFSGKRRSDHENSTKTGNWNMSHHNEHWQKQEKMVDDKLVDE